MAKRLQLLSKFEVIVDFPVEYKDGVSIFRKERLVAAVKIDDFQTHGT